MSETPTNPTPLSDPVPQAGALAPDFELPDADGNRVSLASLRGRYVVLYFYPKDDTPGCTTEACGFRDAWGELQRLGIVVLGVSADTSGSHRHFADKYSLPFTLLADEGPVVARRYGVWVRKNMYGREYEGVARTTFLIGPDGHIAHVWERVKPDGHAEEVLAYVRAHPL
ncbi:MAG TPA: thioredoxin-dependent thiol peroxidase [Ktedonobacterales bacterium]|jgi:peroxiredoxin Q/BCP